MVTAPSYPWQKAIPTTAVEFGAEPLPVLKGAIPPGLRGTFIATGRGD